MRSSGADVPKATTVRLTINAGKPSRKLRFTAPLTSVSPAINRMTRPNPPVKNSTVTRSSLLAPGVAGTGCFADQRCTAGFATPASQHLWGNFTDTGHAQTPEHGQNDHANQKERDDLYKHDSEPIPRPKRAILNSPNNSIKARQSQALRKRTTLTVMRKLHFFTVG